MRLFTFGERADILTAMDEAFLTDLEIITAYLAQNPSDVDHAERLHRIVERELARVRAAAQSAWDAFLIDHPELD